MRVHSLDKDKMIMKSKNFSKSVLISLFLAVALNATAYAQKTTSKGKSTVPQKHTPSSKKGHQGVGQKVVVEKTDGFYVEILKKLILKCPKKSTPPPVCKTILGLE